MINYEKHSILGVTIDAVDYEYVVRQVIEAAERRTSCAISALAVHGVMTGYRDPIQRRRLNALDLVVPDGQPVRWALNWVHNVKLLDRVYGPRLMLQVLETAAHQALPVYFYGSTPETLERLTDNLKQQYPSLDIAGSEPSKFRRISRREKREVIARIKASGARIVFVGLGCPRQETWVYEYKEHLSMPLLAVGAAFDFHAGMVPQAPSWMQDYGLEWLYRLMQEPTRLWERYLVLGPAYLMAVAREAVSEARAPVLMPTGEEPEESYG